MPDILDVFSYDPATEFQAVQPILIRVEKGDPQFRTNRHIVNRVKERARPAYIARESCV